MIIVGFTHKTSKIPPRIFCRRFRHCAPIIIDQNGKMIMHQFVGRKNIVPIPLTMRDLRLLRAHGWTFVCIPHAAQHYFTAHHARTCVGFTCRTIDMPWPHPITPDGLYRKLKKSPYGDFL